MAWIKVPVEHHPVFRSALPRDPRISVIQMFGGLAALYNGHIFAGLFARSIIARLPPDLHAEAMSLDGATLFDPMGKGRPMRDTVLFPEDVMDDDGDLRRWLARAFSHATTLPPKEKQQPKAAAAKKPAAKKPAARRPTANAAAKKPAAKKPAARKSPTSANAAAKKPAAKKPAAKQRPVAEKARRAPLAKKPVAKKRVAASARR